MTATHDTIYMIWSEITTRIQKCRDTRTVQSEAMSEGLVKWEWSMGGKLRWQLSGKISFERRLQTRPNGPLRSYAFIYGIPHSYRTEEAVHVHRRNRASEWNIQIRATVEWLSESLEQDVKKKETTLGSKTRAVTAEPSPLILKERSFKQKRQRSVKYSKKIKNKTRIVHLETRHRTSHMQMLGYRPNVSNLMMCGLIVSAMFIQRSKVK